LDLIGKQRDAFDEACEANKHGCGSPEGTSGGAWDHCVGVAGLVDALLFLGEVVCPVVGKVAVGADRA